MADKRVIELEVKDNLKSVKQQFAEAKKELQQMAAAYGESSAQAIAAAKRAAELKDIIDDTGEAIKNLQGGGAFTALGSSLTATASGFSAVQGALGLVGAEGGKVEEAMLKVQSAMALAQGLQGLEDAGRSFKALGAVAMETFKGIKGALLATGIGVFIAAVGALAANWDKVSESLGISNKKQEALNESLEAYQTGAQEAALKTQKVKAAFDMARSGVVSKEEALKTYNDTLGDSLGKAKSLDEAERLYAAKADAYVKAQAKKAQANALFELSAQKMAEAYTASQENNLSFADQVSAGFTLALGNTEKGTQKVLDAQSKGTKKRMNQLQKEAKDIQNIASKILTESEKIEKENGIAGESAIAMAEKQKEAAQKAADARREAIEKIKQAEQDYADSKLSSDELEIKRTEEKYAELIALAKKYGQDTAVLEQARQDSLFKIRQDAIRKENEDMRADIDALKNRKTEAKTIEIKQNDDMQKINQAGIDAYLSAKKKQRDEEDKLDEARRLREEQRIQTAQNVLSTISSLTEIFAGKSKKSAERAFKVQKAVNIASALIDTYKSATAAYASQFVPAPDPTSPIRGAIAAAAAVAAGIANVKKIAAQKFDGGGSVSAGATGGGGGSTGAGSITPSFNLVGQGSENPLKQFDTQQPVKAYVVSNDVTSQQALDRNIVRNATFG
jgi:hypothetical protein